MGIRALNKVYIYVLVHLSKKGVEVSDAAGDDRGAVGEHKKEVKN